MNEPAKRLRTLWLLPSLAAFAAGLLSASPASAIMARDYGTSFYEHRGQVQACGDGDGTVTVELAISGRGRLASASVTRGDARMTAVGECVLAHARSWQFPTSTSGGHRRYDIRYVGDRFTVTDAPSRY